MANNPYVNKVEFGNTTVMDISDTTAEPQNVLSGEVFYDRSGARQTGTAIGGVPEAELRDTVGWTGKNKIRFPYYDGTSRTSNGATYTVNSDGSITVDTNGQATTGESSFRMIRYDVDQDILNSLNGKSVILSGTSGDVTVQGWWGNSAHKDTGSGLEITVDTTTMTSWNFAVYVASGKTINNVTVYPMLRLASITDSTFEPYHATVDECKYNRSEANVLGAKNLCPYPIGTREVVESTGNIETNVNMYLSDYIDVNNIDKLRMSVAELVGSVSVRFAYYDYSKVFMQRTRVYFSSSVLSFEETIVSGAKYVRICFEDSSSNYVTNPMLCLASDPDNTYAPYAMTNKELTDAVGTIPDVSGMYSTSDTAETDIADADYFPFYDTSATTKRKSLWSNIKSKLETYFNDKYMRYLDKFINKMVEGTGIAGSKEGDVYYPAKWSYSISSSARPNNDGDVFTIKVPSVGGYYAGVYINTGFGGYYPVVLNGTTRLTTQFPAGTCITVIFEESAEAYIYPFIGGTDLVTVSGGAFRVINYYDSNNAVTQTATSTNANYEVLFSATADNTTRTEGARKYSNLKFNPSTGNLQATKLNGVDIGSSPKFTDTNTWRPVQNNLTSTSTSDCLSANQGRLLNNGKSNLISVEAVTITVSEVGATTVADFSTSAEKTGYTPIGIAGTRMDAAGRISLVHCYLSGTTIKMRVFNANSSAKTPGTTQAFVLYVKNSLT